MLGFGQVSPAEDAILGEHRLEREAQHEVEVPNRDLLIEFCTNLELVVSSTWMPNPVYTQFAYLEPHAAAIDAPA